MTWNARFLKKMLLKVQCLRLAHLYLHIASGPFYHRINEFSLILWHHILIIIITKKIYSYRFT